MKAWRGGNVGFDKMCHLGRMAMNKEGLPYLGGKRWQDITRDERYFCAELYYTLSRMPRIADFITWLNEQNTKLDLPVDNEWHVGYEVVFYRDMVKEFGAPSMANNGMTHKIGKTQFSRKRTFDLALFHPNHIVIIEAKADQGLSTAQVDSFQKDKAMIDRPFEKQPSGKPKTHLVLLCTDHYKASKRTKHIPEFDSVITWREIAAKANNWGATESTIECFERADEQMGRKIDQPSAYQ